MKKRVSHIKVNKKKSHSDLLLRNMLYSLLQHGKIETTDARARTLERFANRELAYCVGLEGDQIENRVIRRVGNANCGKLLLYYKEFYGTTGNEVTGALVTSIKTRYRDGDNARMVEVMLLDGDDFKKFVIQKESSTKKKKKKRIRKRRVKKEEKVEKDEGKKKTEEKDEEPEKKEKKETPVKKQARPDIDKGRDGFLSGLRGKILGHKVQGPDGDKRERSTARSGI